ncbi:hypothetical protein SAMN04487915_102383, partial [Arthrobacter sp. ov118]
MWKYLRNPRIFEASGKYSLRWCALGPGGNVCILNRDNVCRLGAILIAWRRPPGDESWCAMKWLLGSATVVTLGGAVLLTPPAFADATLATSTQVVNFSLDSGFCPQHGLYGIAHVTVNGTSGMTADQNFIWTTKTAAASIHSVPPGGAVANVAILYHCNVQVLWWLEPGDARTVTASVWVNGSGAQPDYTISPDRPPHATTPPAQPTQSAPAPTPPAQPTQSAPAPTPPAQPTQSAPAPTPPAQPTQSAPAPTPPAQPTQSAPAPTPPAQPTQPALPVQPAPAPTQPAEPTQPVQQAPAPTEPVPDPTQPSTDPTQLAP